MGSKMTMKSISLRDFWNIFLGGIWIMIAAAIIATGVTYAYGRANYREVYTSTATLYLVGKDEQGNFDETAFSKGYAIALRVMSDCEYLMKSRSVLNEVGEQIGIKNGYSALYSRIKIENPEETRVVEITATYSSPEMAKKIVDGVCKVGAEYINKVFAYDSLSVFEEGTLNKSPINAFSPISYAKYGVLAAAAVYILFLILFLFDNYIHTEEDIERYLGVSVIGEIPDADAPKKKAKYKYRSYRYYRRHSSKYQAPYTNYNPSNLKFVPDETKKNDSNDN
jgi:capsular polysaccharide biosynthesis protein